MTPRFLGGGREGRSKRRKWRSTRGASSRGSPQTGKPSELVLEGFRGECLHNGLCRLGLDHHNLAEHLALPSLGRLLLAGLDHHDAWDDELAVLLRLCRCNAREGAQGCEARDLRQGCYGQ